MGMFRKMKQYTKGKNAAALTHVDIPDENKLWSWMLPHWKNKLNISAEKTILLSFFLALYVWEEIVEKMGIFGPHKRVVEKEQLDEQLGKQHKKHFCQAQGTPFTVSPLTDLFGEALETEFTKDFVEGKANIDEISNISDQTKEFLKNWYQSQQIHLGMSLFSLAIS